MLTSQKLLSSCWITWGALFLSMQPCISDDTATPSRVAVGLAGTSCGAASTNLPVTVPQPTESAAVLATLGGVFRNFAAVDFPLAASRFDPRHNLAFLTNVTVANVIQDTWSRFFSGSFVLAGHLRSESPLTAFYNPFFDTALLTVWTNKTQNPHLIAAWLLVDPSPIRSESEAPSNAQVGDLLLNPYLVGQRLAAFSKWFESQHEPLAITPPPLIHDTPRSVLDLVNKRFTVAQLELAGFERMDQTRTESSWKKFHNTLSGGDVDGLRQLVPTNAGVSADTLLTILPVVRKSIEPGYVVGTRDRLVLFSWNPNAPAYIVISDFALSTKWALSNVDIILMNP